MKQDDEVELMSILIEKTELGISPYVRDLVKQLGMTEKRAVKILCKYIGDYYDYGIGILAGWIVAENIDELKEILKT